MNTENRRHEIMNILKTSENPVKGIKLAEKFGVSRQVIVQDIAILRAEGFDVLATPNGYMVPKDNKKKILKTIVTKHFDVEEVEEELMILIDNGAIVIDVIVDHPIYGDVQGVLNLNYKCEVDNFLDKIRSGKIEFLSSLTEGIHIHTIEVPSDESFVKIKEQLKEKGYLVE